MSSETLFDMYDLLDIPALGHTFTLCFFDKTFNSDDCWMCCESSFVPAIADR